MSHVVGSALSIARVVIQNSEEILDLPRALLLHLYACGLNTEVCRSIMLFVLPNRLPTVTEVRRSMFSWSLPRQILPGKKTKKPKKETGG